MAKMPGGLGADWFHHVKPEDRLSRLSTQDARTAKDDQSLSLSQGQQRAAGRDWVAEQGGIPNPWLAVPCVMYECAPDLTLRSISSNTAELIGIQTENVIGKRSLFEERIYPKDRALLQERLTQLKPGGIVSAVYSIADDRGLPVWVAHSLRKVQAGCEPKIVGCITPVGREFITTKLESSTIAQFIHKIGNHFQLINLLIGAFKRSGTNAEEVEAFQQTIDRAVDFTRSFARFSQSPACAIAVDIGDMLNSATKSISSACAEKNLVLQNVEGPPAILNGDAFLLELAFGAVLQNALEASNPGSQILVGAKVEQGQKACQPIVRITVVDNGAGIEADIMAMAAEPFVSSKRDRDGLGLSTAVRIIELHGGTLSIASSPGRGTKVEIVLPLNADWGQDGE